MFLASRPPFTFPGGDVLCEGAAIGGHRRQHRGVNHHVFVGLVLGPGGEEEERAGRNKMRPT